MRMEGSTIVFRDLFERLPLPQKLAYAYAFRRCLEKGEAHVCFLCRLVNEVLT